MSIDGGIQIRRSRHYLPKLSPLQPATTLSRNRTQALPKRVVQSVNRSNKAAQKTAIQLSAMESSIKPLQILGLTSSIFLSGVCFSSSQLTLPILYRLPTATSTTIFTEFYHRGTATVLPFVVASTLSSATVAYLVPAQRSAHILAGAATFATLPWTIVVMMRGIQRLLKLDESEVDREKAGKEEVVRLLKQWRWMNNVRSVLALVGGVVGVWGLIQ